jgi:hypothetical protein
LLQVEFLHAEFNNLPDLPKMIRTANGSLQGGALHFTEFMWSRLAYYVWGDDYYR